MQDNIKSQFVGTAARLKNNRIKVTQPNQNEQIEKQNTRLVMQAFHGCRKNCQECQEEEQEWSKKTTIRCFYHSKNYSCSFTTTDSQEMENHYRQNHYFEHKEVNHV